MNTLELKSLMDIPGLTIQVTIDDLRELVRMMFRDEQERTRQAIEEASELPTLTRDEVAKMLGVSKSTLWRWDCDGYLVPEKAGTKVLYRRSEIDRLLNLRRDSNNK